MIPVSITIQLACYEMNFICTYKHALHGLPEQASKTKDLHSKRYCTDIYNATVVHIQY